MSEIKVEMNPYSKQYERICEDATPTLMMKESIPEDVKKEESILSMILDSASIDWSTCE